MIQFGGQTPLKLARALERGRLPRSSARRTTRSTSPRIASASASSASELGVRCPPGGSRRRAGRGGRGRRADRLPGARPAVATCSAAARCGSATTAEDVREAMRRASRGRCSSTASSRTRSRSTSTRSATARRPTSPRSWSTSRRPASTRATRPACCRRPRSTPATRARDRRASSAGSRRRSASSGSLNVQLALADGERVRARGEPARVAHGPVREQGDRREPRRGRLPARRGRDARRPRRCRRSRDAGAGVRQGGRAPVRPLPRRRPGARPGDALDRRGDGDRRRLRRPRSRRPSAPRAGRCPTSGTAFLSVRDARQARRRARRAGARRARLRARRDAGTAARSPQPGSRSSACAR